MRVTATYVGTQRGQMNYLFLLLTEDFIESHKRISEALNPLLEKFARDLDTKGALVRPFTGDERKTLGNVLDKNWSQDQVANIQAGLPAILIIDVDFDVFDPKNCNYILISLRQSISEFGDVEIFKLQQLLSNLVLGAWISDLFRVAHEYLKAQKKDELRKIAWDALEVKPGVYWINLDLKKGIEFFQTLRK